MSPFLASGAALQTAVATTGACGALTYLLLWSRLIPKCLQRLWFSSTLISLFLADSVFCGFVRVAKALRLVSHNTFQSILRQATAFSMHVHRHLNPHITMTPAPGSMRWDDLTDSHLLFNNHTSKHDLFGGLWIVPLKYMSMMRIFFKASVAHVPLLGPLLVASGDFPVHYSTEKWDDFSVERQKQVAVNERVDAFLASGGTLMLAPEGCINRNPRTLREFRIGSFLLAVKHKMPIYYIVYCGMEEVWSPESTFGGNAADVMYYISTFDVSYEPNSPDLDAKVLAKRLREEMQGHLDRMYLLRTGKSSTRDEVCA